MDNERGERPTTLKMAAIKSNMSVIDYWKRIKNVGKKAQIYNTEKLYELRLFL
ncbi:MAG: hypothetical protein LBH98_09650 [Chitinispirillales bacterium]|jgi:hypothetical protein|nr:hypothetical protein [Chitinispirillales bacterium]